MGTLAKRQAPKYLDQNGLVKTGNKSNSLLLKSQAVQG